MSSTLRRILPAAAVLSLFGILSRVLGVVRDRLLTSTFGRSIETDSFLASNRVPDLIYQLLIVGAVSSVLIPAYTSARERGEDEAKRFAGNVMTLVLGALALTSLAAFLLATPLARVLTAGFDSTGIELTATLMRIQLIAPILLGASSICAALLQTHGTFWTFAIAPVLYNVGQIIGISALSRTYGIEGAAWGVGIGALLHLLIQIPSTLRVHPVLTPRAPLQDHAVRTMLRQALPRILALAGSQVNLLVETMLASLLVAGSITALTYGQNLMSFPLGVFGIPIAIAAFPTFALFAARGEHGLFRDAVLRSVRQALFWVLPAGVGIVVLRYELTGALFLSSRFTTADVETTATAVAAFSLSLVTQALIPLFARAFYAWHDTRRPVEAVIWSILLNIALSMTFVLALGWGVVSLAIAFTLASALNLALHAWHIGRYLGPRWSRPVWPAIIRMLIASAAMGALVYALNRVLIATLHVGPWADLLLRLGICSAAGGVVYIVLMRLYNGGEFREALALRRGAPDAAASEAAEAVAEH